MAYKSVNENLNLHNQTYFAEDLEINQRITKNYKVEKIVIKVCRKIYTIQNSYTKRLKMILENIKILLEAKQIHNFTRKCNAKNVTFKHKLALKTLPECLDSPDIYIRQGLNFWFLSNSLRE